MLTNPVIVGTVIHVRLTRGYCIEYTSQTATPGRDHDKLLTSLRNGSCRSNESGACNRRSSCCSGTCFQEVTS